jgi:hypothetical protein
MYIKIIIDKIEYNALVNGSLYFVIVGVPIGVPVGKV